MMSFIFSTNISQDLGRADKTAEETDTSRRIFQVRKTGQERPVNYIEKPGRVAMRREEQMKLNQKFL